MDYEEIQERLKNIIEMAPKAIPDSEMANIHKEIEKSCPKSKPFFEEMIKCMPGGTQHQMVIKQPFAVTMKKCLGARMWDVDDNEYIDYLMSAGACILGHCYPPLDVFLRRTSAVPSRAAPAMPMPIEPHFTASPKPPPHSICTNCVIT